MTTARATIAQGLRESNLLAISAAPTADQLVEGLGKLNTLVASVFGFEAGTKLVEWPVGATGTSEFSVSWTSADWSLPPANVRLMVTSTDAQTITLPPFPENGARIGLVDLTGTLAAHHVTLNPNGAKIEGSPVPLVMNVNNINAEWMFRSDLGDWRRITLLALDDSLPFPIQFDTYFETMLAMRLNPRYGRQIDAQTSAALQRSLTQLRATYRQRRAVRAPEDVLRMPNTGQGSYYDDCAGSKTARNDIWLNR